MCLMTAFDVFDDCVWCVWLSAMCLINWLCVWCVWHDVFNVFAVFDDFVFDVFDVFDVWSGKKKNIFYKKVEKKSVVFSPIKTLPTSHPTHSHKHTHTTTTSLTPSPPSHSIGNPLQKNVGNSPTNPDERTSANEPWKLATNSGLEIEKPPSWRKKHWKSETHFPNELWVRFGPFHNHHDQPIF